MPRQSIISPEPHPIDAADPVTSSPSLRPRTMREYVGQPDLVEKLGIALEAVQQRGDPMEHVLLHGPPGLGKTTLAHVIAAEMGTRAHIVSGPSLTKASDLVGTLTKVLAREVLFIDEIHRVPPAVEEFIYPAMEDFKIDVTVDSGMHAKVISIDLQPFTLIGATTRAGMLTGALRSRFGITHHLQFYDEDELALIMHRAADRLGLTEISEVALRSIARRSRGTPRVALRLLRRARDFAQVRAQGEITEQVISDALGLERVDELGLDELDRAYLRTLGEVYRGGPAGVEAIAASLGQDAGTLEDMVEPYLLRIGFVARTPRGRVITEPASRHMRLAAPPPPREGELPFDEPTAR